MGMPISVESTRIFGEVAVFDTDRSITGQDGAGFGRVEGNAAPDTIPGTLAARLFAVDEAVDHAFVASSQVVLRRDGGWDAAALARMSDTISGFFVHYV